MKFVFALLALALSLSAADLTGRWTGSYDVVMADGEAMKGKVLLVLTQNGSDLSGTVGAAEDQSNPISKGHIESDDISFESQTEGPLMRFTLHLADEHLRGEANGEVEGNKIKAKLDLTRE